MKELSKILEDIEEEREVIVTFKDGECFGLNNFEMVDESIYNRSDLCDANIISIRSYEKGTLRVGNKMEFSIEEVVKVEDTTNGVLLYCISHDEI